MFISKVPAPALVWDVFKMKLKVWSRRLFFALGLLATPAVVAADPITIGFERFPGPDGKLNTSDDEPVPRDRFNFVSVILKDQFTSLGVSITSTAVIHRGRLSDSNPENGTPENPWWDFDNHWIVAFPFEGTFSIPIYGVSIDSYNNQTTTMIAFGADDNVLGSAEFVNPMPGQSWLVRGTLSVSSPSPIARFTVRPAIGTALDLDNLVLQTDPTQAAPVPEPSTLLLIGTGLAGLCRKRKRWPRT